MLWDRAPSPPERSRAVVVAVLGLGQILAWGSTYYLPAVLAQPIAADTGWPLAWIITGLSIGSIAAGLIAHRVGRLIQARGGRLAMAAGSGLLAIGLLGIGLSPSLPYYLLAWVIVGIGMGCALYDAAFSTVAVLYRQNARRLITALTLFGGFSSTVCWPLSTFFLEQLGWRGTCLAYATLHLAIILPLYWRVLPSPSAAAGRAERSHVQVRAEHLKGGRSAGREWFLFALVVTVSSLGWAISSVLSVHLLALLQARGLELAAAVALGVLVGPSQVGGRAVEMALGTRHHPIWTLLISTSLVAIGLALLTMSAKLNATALICYGAGAGLASIARGTLPLAIFGPDQYPVWMGRLTGPTLVAGALSPVLTAILLDRTGAILVLQMLQGLALLNVSAALLLWWLQTKNQKRARTKDR